MSAIRDLVPRIPVGITGCVRLISSEDACGFNFIAVFLGTVRSWCYRPPSSVSHCPLFISSSDNRSSSFLSFALNCRVNALTSRFFGLPMYSVRVTNPSLLTSRRLNREFGLPCGFSRMTLAACPAALVKPVRAGSRPVMMLDRVGEHRGVLCKRW